YPDRLATRRRRYRGPLAGAVDLPGPRQPGKHLLVLLRGPRADAAGRGRARPPVREPVMSALAPLMEAFFTDRLINQRGASANTIAGYRDTFRLLLGFAATQTGKKPSGLDIADLDAPLVAAFLDHLEHERGNKI